MNLIELLAREIERVSKLQTQYDELPGGAGRIASALIQVSLNKAHTAMGTGEALDMLVAFEDLKEITG